MHHDLIDDKSTLVQVMAWCCEATTHYLIQYWPNSMMPYGKSVHSNSSSKWQPEGIFGISVIIYQVLWCTPRCMLHYLTDEESTLVQVMAWCHQAPSHYLIRCWPSSMSPYGITRPQWVNTDNSPSKNDSQQVFFSPLTLINISCWWIWCQLIVFHQWHQPRR